MNAMKTSLLPALAVAALLPLAACGDNKPQVVDSRPPDPMAEKIKAAPPVELPPPVAASVTMRCKDNSLIFVDFFQGYKMANLRLDKTALPTQLKAPEKGQPFVGGDYTLTGDAKSVELKGPGGDKSCKA